MKDQLSGEVLNGGRKEEEDDHQPGGWTCCGDGSTLERPVGAGWRQIILGGKAIFLRRVNSDLMASSQSIGRRPISLEKALKLGKVEGRRRRGWPETK